MDDAKVGSRDHEQQLLKKQQDAFDRDTNKTAEKRIALDEIKASLNHAQTKVDACAGYDYWKPMRIFKRPWMQPR